METLAILKNQTGGELARDITLHDMCPHALGLKPQQAMDQE